MAVILLHLALVKVIKMKITLMYLFTVFLVKVLKKMKMPSVAYWQIVFMNIPTIINMVWRIMLEEERNQRQQYDGGDRIISKKLNLSKLHNYIYLSHS